MKTKTILLILIALTIVVLDIYVSYLFLGQGSADKADTNQTANPLTASPTVTVEKRNFSEVKSSENKDENKNEQNIDAKTQRAWEDLLASIPTNPNQIIATAKSGSSGDTLELKSGVSYSFPEVTFTWSGAKPREKGTKIIGYYVYFGSKNTEIPFPKIGFETSVNPKSEGTFTEKNVFVAKNLQKGQTYHLYIQSVSNSKNANIYYRFGMEIVGPFQTLSAKKLFTYIYQ